MYQVSDVTVSQRYRNLMVWVLLVGTGVIKMASYFSTPFLAIFLTKNLSLTPITIGFILGVSPLFGLVGGFLGGYLTDRFGQLTIIKISLFSTASLFIAFHLVFEFQILDRNIWLLSFINAGLGFFSSLFQPSSQALLTSLLPINTAHFTFQIRYAILNMGAIFGLLFGLIFGLSGHTLAFLISRIMHFIFLGILLLISLSLNWPRTNSSELPSFSSILGIMRSDSRLRSFVIAGILFNICYIQLETTLSEYLVNIFDNGIVIFTWLLTINCVTVIIAQFCIYRINKILSAKNVIFLGIIIFMLGCLVFIFSNKSETLFYIAMIIASIGEAFVFPATGYYIAEIASERLRGSYFGASNLRQLGIAIGPALGGYALHNYDGNGLFVCTLSVAFIAAAIQFFEK